MHPTNTYPITLRRADGSAEALTYRLPSLRQMGRYLTLLADTPSLAEWLCGQPEGWADQWTDDSLYALADAVEEQMRPRVAAYLERQAAQAERMAPLGGTLGRIAAAAKQIQTV